MSSPWFLCNAIRAIECGWVVQLNGDGTLGFCRADVNMIGPGFFSMGDANNPACWSYVPYQTEGELMYTLTYYQMQRATLALLTVNVDKDCEFTRYLKHLSSNFSVTVFGKLPNICCNHLTSKLRFIPIPICT